MGKKSTWAIGITIGIALSLAALWLIRLVYMFLASYFFPEGAEQFIRPDYWPFVGVWWLIGLVGHGLFHRA